jgi:O-antigen ligase
MGNLRIEYALVVAVVVFFGASKLFRVFHYFKYEVLILFAMLCFSMFGLLNQSMASGTVTSRDYMIIFRFGFYVSVFVFCVVCAGHLKRFQDDMLYLYFFGFCLISLTLIQYYNLFGINQIVKPYAPEDIERMKILVEQAGWRRAVGTLGNPNYWGLIISIVACVVSYRLFWRKRWIYAPLLLGLLGAVLFTGSRAALVAYCGALVIGGCLFLFALKKKPSGMVVLVFAALAGVTLLRLEFTSEVETSERYSLDRLGTLEMRVAMWGQILGEMSENPISFVIGQGTRKDARIVGFADNAYVKILREHGLIGLIPYLFLIGFMIRRTLNLVKEIDDDNRAWPGGLFLLLLAWAIFDLSADTWYGPRLMGAILVLYGFVHTVGANRLADTTVRKAETARAEPPRDRVLSEPRA